MVSEYKYNPIYPYMEKEREQSYGERDREKYPRPAIEKYPRPAIVLSLARFGPSEQPYINHLNRRNWHRGKKTVVDVDPASNIQKKIHRAKRFGVSLQLTEEEKRNSRKERSELQVMEHPVSSWCNGRSLLESYIFPPEKRPGKRNVPPADNIPVIDLGGHDQTVIQQILKASKEFGFFQAINHGVPSNLMDEAMGVFKVFHALSGKDKAIETSKDPKKSCVIYPSSVNYETEKFHFWRDVLVHHCGPLKDCIQFWPEQPPRYREVVGPYTAEVSKLESRILDFIYQGLGISLPTPDGIQTLAVNHYPRCPDPSLTLGLGKHMDPVFINILLQSDVHGLQVFKDEEWIGVEPIPNAFVVNIGYALQIISNGKLKAAEHRVVTNSNVARTTASYFLSPSNETLIEPAKSLVDASHPAFCEPLLFKDLRIKCVAASADT